MRKQFYISYEEPRVPHEYLSDEDYYETTSVVTRARSNYTCEQCGEVITKGNPHETHKFYPEFESYRTHKECSSKFIKSLIKDSDPVNEEY